MNLKRILESGYFPKELPPPFETLSFAKKSRYIKVKWESLLKLERIQKGSESSTDAKRRFNRDYNVKYGSSQLVIFSLAKGVFSRRKLGIPNPKQFLDLAISINDNWGLLRDTCKLSNYSQSSPIEYGATRSVRTKSKSWNEFKFELIEKSFNKKVELLLDISQFYPSIYTHSIPWSILGKDRAKRYFKIKNTQKTHWKSILATDHYAKNYRISDHIDTLVRNCNERQSIGLPIGPDTSFLLAECLGSRIDNEIENKLKDIEYTCIRYYDDYYFYLNSIDAAEIVLKQVQQILNEFQLETNESKVSINTIPFKYTEAWASKISSFNFQKIDKYELRSFFSIIYDILDENKSHSTWIVHYALGRFEYGYTRVNKISWAVFLSFLLKTLLIDPSNIDQIFKIIISYKEFLNKKSKEKISAVIQTIINDHVNLNHSFEVSWSLWILKSLKIKCPSNILTSVLKTNDSISKIVCLDLINSSLYVGRKPGLSILASTINGSQLFTNEWLLSYESYIKGWLDFKGRNILEKNKFMHILHDYGVSFYNPNNQIATNFIEGEEVSVTPVTTRIVRRFYDSYDTFSDDNEDGNDLVPIPDDLLDLIDEL